MSGWRQSTAILNKQLQQTGLAGLQFNDIKLD